MAQILVRDLDERVVKRLKARAERHGRSLQGEVKAILEREATRKSAGDRLKIIAEARALLKGRTFSDSAELIREDRDSR
jgi:antitoxin FitA